MNRLSAWIGMGLVLCAVGLLGCGDDDDSTPSGTGGAGAGGSMDGTGGIASGSGGMGSGGMSATVVQPIMCGTNMCRPPTNPLGALLGGGMGGGLLPMPVPCCLPDNACGVAMSATATCAMKATPDTRCPSVSAAGLLNVAGCCTDMGQCGLDGALFGRGCVENGEAKSMLAQLATFVMVPEARACDAMTTDDGGVTEDAGP